MSLLKILDLDVANNIYLQCSYIAIYNLRLVSKFYYMSVKNNKPFQYKIKQCKNYFNYTKKIHFEIISYLESLFKFKNQVVDLPIFSLYYNKDKSYLSSSINYFLYIYYREFNSNILNKAFLCPKCKKFNFLENIDDIFCCKVCDCKEEYNEESLKEQPILSNFQQKLFIEYNVVNNLNIFYS